MLPFEIKPLTLPHIDLLLPQTSHIWNRPSLPPLQKFASFEKFLQHYDIVFFKYNYLYGHSLLSHLDIRKIISSERFCIHEHIFSEARVNKTTA